MEPSGQSGEVTRLLQAVQAGDAGAADRLVELVYGELRGLAAALMRRERPGHTLQPTALVHEAVARLLGGDALARAETRAYFFGAVARAMRRVLREHARSRKALRHGGGWARTPLDDVLDAYARQGVDVGELDDALGRLAALHARQAEVVSLHYFGGWTLREVAGLLGVSLATAENDHRAARAFLRGLLGEGGPK